MHIYGLDHKYKYSYLQHLNIKSMMTPSANVRGNHYITSTNVIGNHYITSTNVCIIWHCCKALTLYFCKIGKSILFSLKNVLISFLHTGTHKYYV